MRLIIKCHSRSCTQQYNRTNLTKVRFMVYVKCFGFTREKTS